MAWGVWYIVLKNKQLVVGIPYGIILPKYFNVRGES